MALTNGTSAVNSLSVSGLTLGCFVLTAATVGMVATEITAVVININARIFCEDVLNSMVSGDALNNTAPGA